MKPATSRHLRRGIAPLELVMVLPLIAGLFFAMFSIVKASLTRMDAIEAARFETWRKLPAMKTSRQLVLNTPWDDGDAQYRAVETVRLGGWWAGQYSPESRNRTLAGTWDNSVVPFDKRQPAFLAHLLPTVLIADQAKLGTLTKGFLQIFSKVLDLPANPLAAGLGVASRLLMPVVKFAGSVLKLLRPVLKLTRFLVSIARFIAQVTFQRSLARFLGRVMNLLSLGIDAFEELSDASKEEEVDWPKGGLDVDGAFP